MSLLRRLDGWYARPTVALGVAVAVTGLLVLAGIVAGIVTATSAP